MALGTTAVADRRRVPLVAGVTIGLHVALLTPRRARRC